MPSFGFGDSPGSTHRLRGIVRVAAESKRHEVVVLNLSQRAGVTIGCCVATLFCLSNGGRRLGRRSVDSFKLDAECYREPIERFAENIIQKSP